MAKTPDLKDILGEFNGGVFTEQVEAILKQAALGVIYHGVKNKKAKVTLTFALSRADDPDRADMVDVEHTWSFDVPTKRGKRTETNTTETPMHVNRDGYLSLIALDQGDMFGKPALVTPMNGDKS